MTLQINERALVFRALAQEVRPAPPIAPSAWAAANLIVPDGPQAGRRFDLSLTPYLAEPLDMLGPDSPVNEIAVMKSAQSGFTLLLIALVGHLVDRNPARIMVVQPTDAAVSEFNREKLDPAIKATAALRRKVEPQTPRAGEGSTTYSKKFPGGSLTLAISTSAADLRSKTVKVLLRDEIDQYPDDLDGQGNPLDISDARLTAFLASGEWKKADISTPTIKGASKIESALSRWRSAPMACAVPGLRRGIRLRVRPAIPLRAELSARGLLRVALLRDGDRASSET